VTGQPAVPPQAHSEPASRLAQSDGSSRPSRGPLIFAAAVAITWGAFLIGMALLTANPVTLNRDQILRADFVITGNIESEPATGEVSVSREWKKKGLTGTIHVENLDEARARRGTTYVMPLTHASTGYRVTDARMANSAALVYPATPAAIEQLERILADRAGKN
jgi:hypothetical protein